MIQRVSTLLLAMALMVPVQASAGEWVEVAVKDDQDVTVYVGAISNAQSKTYPRTSTFGTATLTLTRTVTSGVVEYCVNFEATANSSNDGDVCHVLNLTTLNASIIDGHGVGLMTGDDSGTPPPPGGVGGILSSDPFDTLSVEEDSDGDTHQCKCCLYDENNNKTCDEVECTDTKCNCDTTSGSPVASCG